MTDSFIGRKEIKGKKYENIYSKMLLNLDIKRF